MRRILIISALLLAVVFTATADRRRLMMARNVAVVTIPTPIYRLEMNEGSGLSMADSSGNANTFTNLGATWITGKSGSGGALQFDGVNDFAKSQNTVTVAANTTNWTFCTWVWWDAFANDDDLLVEISANSTSSGSDGAFLIDPNSSSPSGVAAFLVQDSSAGSIYRTETIAR